MDQPLVEMVTGTPQPRLAPLVADYSGYRIEGAPPGVHRGLPARHLTVIVTLAGTVDLAAVPDSTQPPASFTTLAGGLPATPVLISHDGHQHGIHLHLTPLDAVLAGIVKQRDGPAPELEWAWRRLSANHGQIEVATLAGEVGWSRRHLGEQFRREFGLTPKVAGRVMRFELAHRLLRAPHRPSLADVAVRAGFYDQAHLHREWRELAGCTPTRWLAEEFPSVQDHQLRNGASSMA